MNVSSDISLLERYLERALTDEEEVDLRQRLLREPALAETLVLLAREEAMLVEWAKSAREADAAAARGARPFRFSARARFFRSARAAVLAGALAACLLVTLLADHFNTVPSAPSAPAVARLQQSLGDVEIITASGAKERGRAGRLLFAGEKVRTGGDDSGAVVRFTNKARLALGSDTLLELSESAGEDAAASRERVSILHGYVHGDFSGQASVRPMLIETPHAELEVRGQRFRSWTVPTETRIEMEEGLAQRVRRKDGRTIWLERGKYVVAAAEAEQFNPHELPGVIGNPIVLQHGEGPLLALAFAPHGGTLTTGGWRGTVKHWDAETGGARRSAFTAHGPRHPKIFALGYSPDGKILVTSGQDKRLRFWNPKNGRLRRDAPKLSGEAKAMAFSPTERWVATVGDVENKRAAVRIWDVRAGKQKRVFTEGTHRFTCVAFSPDGKQLAVGARDGFVYVWDVKRRRLLNSFRAHKEQVRALAYSVDGLRLATGGQRDHLVRLWTTDSFEEAEAITGRFRNVQALVFAPQANVLAIATDGLIKLWDLRGNIEAATIHADAYLVTAMAFSPDGTQLAAAGWKRAAKIWHVGDVLRPRPVRQ